MSEAGFQNLVSSEVPVLLLRYPAVGESTTPAAPVGTPRGVRPGRGQNQDNGTRPRRTKGSLLLPLWLIAQTEGRYKEEKTGLKSNGRHPSRKKGRHAGGSTSGPRRR